MRAKASASMRRHTHLGSVLIKTLRNRGSLKVNGPNKENVILSHGKTGLPLYYNMLLVWSLIEIGGRLQKSRGTFGGTIEGDLNGGIISGVWQKGLFIRGSVQF